MKKLFLTAILLVSSSAFAQALISLPNVLIEKDTKQKLVLMDDLHKTERAAVCFLTYNEATYDRTLKSGVRYTLSSKQEPSGKVRYRPADLRLLKDLARLYEPNVTPELVDALNREQLLENLKRLGVHAFSKGVITQYFDLQSQRNNFQVVCHISLTIGTDGIERQMSNEEFFNKLMNFNPLQNPLQRSHFYRVFTVDTEL